MNQAIKLNPNFATAFLDRGITFYDKHDYDRTIASVDPVITRKPTYAVNFSDRGSAYENRREGDRIIQDANQPIRNNQYNAYAYSADTFPLVTPATLDRHAGRQRRSGEPVAVRLPTPRADRQARGAGLSGRENVPMPQARPQPRAEQASPPNRRSTRRHRAGRVVQGPQERQAQFGLPAL